MRLDLAGNLIDIGHAVHRLQLALGIIVADQRRGFLVVGLRDACVIVSALSSGRRLKWVEPHLSQTPSDLRLVRWCRDSRCRSWRRYNGRRRGPTSMLVVDIEFDDDRELDALGLQHRLGGIGLHERARETVEDEALGAIGLIDSLGDDGIDDLVGDQIAGVHDSLGALADFRAGLNGGTQHVTRGKLRNAMLLHDPLGLGPLPRARRPQQV